MKKFSVSGIIVVQNGERYLAEAIESVLAQTCQLDEIIVVNGESTDNTEKIAKSYQQVTYLRQTGRGLANARNNGIHAASGDLIAFLDYDDYWTSNKLSTQVDYLIKNPESQYTSAKVKLFLQPGCSLRPGFRKTLLEEEQLGRTPGTLVARKSLFRLIGEFNPEFTIGCDAEWFARAKDCRIPTAIIPEVLLYKRIHSANLSGNVQVNRQELLTIVRQSLKYQRQYKPQLI